MTMTPPCCTSPTFHGGGGGVGHVESYRQSNKARFKDVKITALSQINIFCEGVPITFDIIINHNRL